MIDTHTHILPNVDDGSVSMEMSIDMARKFVENGFDKIIATPHFIEGRKSTNYYYNKKKLELLKLELFKLNIPLDIYLGNEIYLSIDNLDNIRNKIVTTLNESRYILVELPMHDIPLYFEEWIYQVILKGYIPIIAHPERNLKIINNPNILFEYINKGVLSQLNLPALEGRYGKTIESTAKTLIKHKMVHFIGTDSHTNRLRSPDVSYSIEILKSLTSEDYFHMITENNAELLLQNKEIPAIEANKLSIPLRR